MRKVSVIITIVFVLSYAVSVYAEGSGYVALKGGIFDPNDEDDGLKDFETGYNAEIAFGYRMNPNVAFEFGIGKYSSDFEESGFIIDVFGNVYPAQISFTASAIPVTATVKGIAPTGGGVVDLYIGGGLGYYMAKIEADLEISGLGSASDSFDEEEVGFHVVGGAEFNVSENIALGLEAKWFTVEPEFDFDGEKEKVEFGGAIFNGILKFSF